MINRAPAWSILFSRLSWEFSDVEEELESEEAGGGCGTGIGTIIIC